MKYDLLLLCSGLGTRFYDKKSKSQKLLEIINGKTIIEKALTNFVTDNNCLKIIITINNNYTKTIIKDIQKISKKIEFVIGGSTRSESSKLGLLQVKSEYVLIHDGARPFISKKLITNIISKLEDNDAVIPIIPVVDCIKLVKNEKILTTLNRNELFKVQTPQGFKTSIIKEAYKLYSKTESKPLFLMMLKY